MHQLIASPYNGTFLIARPGSKGGMRIPRALYEELASTAESSGPLPAWLLDHARTAWSLDLAGGVMRDAVPVHRTVGVRFEPTMTSQPRRFSGPKRIHATHINYSNTSAAQSPSR
ncbi:hypothetical protein ACWCQF_10820 [Streptomyces rubiginosohelvolus]|uniref:hypothetical protein n=1 Tax=Streptomyces TaxID=1883 RepID=UPI0015C5851F|nr:hypothetical protein [Streptomyces sp. SS07]